MYRTLYLVKSLMGNDKTKVPSGSIETIKQRLIYFYPLRAIDVYDTWLKYSKYTYSKVSSI